MAYRIEPGTLIHVPWLRLFFMRWTAEVDPGYPAIDEEEYDNFVITVTRNLTMNPDFYLAVAIIGRRVIGFLGGEVSLRPIGKPHRFGRAHWLYVVPKHRGKGVAKQLIAHGLAWMAERGLDVCELSELAAMHGDWERRGFQPFLINYYQPVAAIFAGLRPMPNGQDHQPHG
jgi:GNAT superfamily N-acetyltransferase